MKFKIDAREFWEEYKKTNNTRLHICEIPKEVFYAKHRNALALIKDKGYDALDIGMLIAGKYYSDVWSSRSCSGYLSRLVGGNDYMDFYCGSSIYYSMINSPLKGNPILEDFKEADLKDEKGYL
jgi:hypothetical protein